MKRLIALVMALVMLASAAAADVTTTEELSGGAVVVLRNHEETETEYQQIVVDYPTFVCSDAELETFLKETITDAITEEVMAARPLRSTVGVQTRRTL